MMTTTTPDLKVLRFDLRCWNCLAMTTDEDRDVFTLRPDAGMNGLTDEIVCNECGAVQDADKVLAAMYAFEAVYGPMFALTASVEKIREGMAR